LKYILCSLLEARILEFSKAGGRGEIDGYNTTDRSWYQIEKALADVTAGLIESDHVNLWYCSDISDEAKDIFKKLDIALPKKVLSAVERKAAAAV